MTARIVQLSSLGLALALVGGAAAVAQTTTSAPSWTTGGYNGASSVTSSPYQPQTQTLGSAGDIIALNGNMHMASSVVQANGFSGGGAGNASTGAGGNTASAIGNMINVQVTGSGDTIVINANQNNSAGVSANVSR